MPGARETAERILDRQARLGAPLHLSGLAEAVSGPAFSAVCGLLQYAAFGAREEYEAYDLIRDRRSRRPFARHVARRKLRCLLARSF